MIVWSLYKITNKNTGKLYIGQTTDTLAERWREHRTKAARDEGCPLLRASIRKHGPEAFTIELLAMRFDAAEADQLEGELIGRFKTLDKNFGYNYSKFGGHHPVYCRNGGHKLDRSGGCRICAKAWKLSWRPPDGSTQRQYFNRKQLEYTAKVDSNPEARAIRLAKKRDCERRRLEKETPEQREIRLAKRRVKKD